MRVSTTTGNNNSEPHRQHIRSHAYDFNDSKPHRQHLRSHAYEFNNSAPTFNDFTPTSAETIISF